MSQTDFSHEKLALEGRALAWRQDGHLVPGRPSLLFLPGFYSDMTGSKASFLAEKCVAEGGLITRLDYRGHGLSSGAFVDGCISDWLSDSLTVVDAVTEGPLIVIGSSMGGWLMLLLALARPERVAGLVGIAAAPDFTEDLVWDKLDESQRVRLIQEGVIYEPSEYGAPVPYTRRLVEEGRTHLLLRGDSIPITVPVRLLQGMKDADVPWQTAPRLAEKLAGSDVRITLIKDGDHRLSRDADLALLWDVVSSLL